MRSTAAWTIVITSGIGLALAAQTTMGTGALPESGQAATPAASIATVAGCIQRVDNGGHYVLTHTSTLASGGDMLDALKFTPGQAAKGVPAHTTVGSWVKSSDLTLIAQTTSVRLDKHAGHQVEVTGSLQQPVTAATTGTTEPPAAGTAGAPAAETAPQGTMGTSAMHVTSVRMIAKTCR